MLFNSVSYALFLPIVFLFYWYVTYRKLKLQNLLLLVSSFFFYACWDWRFMFLLLFSVLLDYITGIKIFEAKTARYKLVWLWLSIVINLGFLACFKYYNFFIETLETGLDSIHVHSSFRTLNIILPVGISFYTFHGLSYVIDIYKNRIVPERNFVVYSVFVSFFPLLVAGPIERATHLLPQIKKERNFDTAQAVSGLRQILWGLFKKIVIADNCAVFVNLIFDHSTQYDGSTLFVGALLFSFQIYGDFSGYSDIALGTAKLFGINLLRNFAFPYFSRDIAEFWRRWHISLSSWFRDYLYIPLGGSKVGIGVKIRNTLIIFLVSGLWHGANWTFVVWGALNAIYFLPLLIRKKNRDNIEIIAKGKFAPKFNEFLFMSATFILVVLTWIFFRAESISHALQILKSIFSVTLFSLPVVFPRILLLLILAFMLVEWLGREGQYALDNMGNYISKPWRYTIYFTIIFSIFWFNGEQQQFIYFQF